MQLHILMYSLELLMVLYMQVYRYIGRWCVDIYDNVQIDRQQNNVCIQVVRRWVRLGLLLLVIIHFHVVFFFFDFPFTHVSHILFICFSCQIIAKENYIRYDRKMEISDYMNGLQQLYVLCILETIPKLLNMIMTSKKNKKNNGKSQSSIDRNR